MQTQSFLGSGFQNLNEIEELYDKFQKDPSTVDPSWRDFFAQLDSQGTFQTSSVASVGGDARVWGLINAYRFYGHLVADINPLSPPETEQPIQLRLKTWGISDNELANEVPTFGLLNTEKAPLSKVIETLKKVYTGKVGFEYMGFNNPPLEKWIQQRIEPGGITQKISVEQKRELLDVLNNSEVFESFLHTKFPGQKRFSLEGAESLIPMLTAIIDKGAETGLKEFFIGMAHRGRLNVLAHILNKPYEMIFTEFDEHYVPDSFEESGDVKYHKGFYSETVSSHGHKVSITLTPNPSHLEAVNAVIEGQVRAKQTLWGTDGFKHAVPILIHGDAALSGQGVVYETLQMYKLPNYSTGGTIHLVINNQIGFTTLPEHSRSTRYCTDVAKGFGFPIFHVNGEDPESCISAALLAIEIRNQFNCDVFLDIYCYRKYGHNEADEPAFTQPVEYQQIRAKKPVRDLYRDQLIREGIIETETAMKLEQTYRASLQKVLDDLKPNHGKINKTILEPHIERHGDPSLFHHSFTGVPAEKLQEVAERISAVPTGFNLNPKLQNLVKDRYSMVQGNKPLDWGMAELLAYGSLLQEGKNIRLAGQDSCRGTFSHRHAMWVDQKTSNRYFPLQHISEDQGTFEVLNTLLSEYAALGFELGYSIGMPEALVIWEAQFGDFANGAQIMIDQFITTGEQKWSQKTSLMLLLPHGYEGQGPEHSSARIERFLTLAGNDNIQIVDPTTPAQLFHLIRRQALRTTKKPLVVFTPKGLLRHPECISTLQELTQGCFLEILDDPTKPKDVETLVFCTGRIYYDLDEVRKKEQHERVALIRIEQLYPLHRDFLKEIINKYQGFKKCLWVQEEPGNMGAGDFLRPIFEHLIPPQQFHVVARNRSASPAVGSHALHDQEKAEIMAEVFGKKQPTIFDIAGTKKKNN